MSTSFDLHQISAMRAAMESASRALAFIGGDEQKVARTREMLAHAILEVTSAGVRDPGLISSLALGRLPPAPACYRVAREAGDAQMDRTADV